MVIAMNWYTLTPVLTFMGGGLMTFFVQRLLDKHRNADRIALVDRTNSLLLEENASLKKAILDQKEQSDAVSSKQAEVIEYLSNALAKHEDCETILSRFKFDIRTGTFIGNDGFHYCARCLKEHQWPRESQVQPTAMGSWCCPVCRCTTYTQTDLEDKYASRPNAADVAARVRSQERR